MYHILIFTLLMATRHHLHYKRKLKVYEHVAGLHEFKIIGMVTKVKGYQTVCFREICRNISMSNII